MLLRLFSVLSLGLLVACGAPADLAKEPRVTMGDFRLGHKIVVSNGPEKAPFSRNATDEELIAALETALDDRFGAYQGDKFYHIGIKVDLYGLARPGVPVVFNPKSVFVVTVNVWDDAKQERLTDEGGKALTVFEGASKETLISSGLLRSRDKQLAVMSANVAKAIQDYILENPEWVGLTPEQVGQPAPPILRPEPAPDSPLPDTNLTDPATGA